MFLKDLMISENLTKDENIALTILVKKRIAELQALLERKTNQEYELIVLSNILLKDKK
jgi:hypothetical protein